ncbi:bridging integrator 3 isoform X2 [Parasteatoda tepidariorum]|uniref:bridging integrator 3 isoform X2 n=1 Tax=Parasteatoda tepidariorum TaxID=114398 RepID=UPI00077FA9B7|nr:bridging integrator 3 isoform X2 [Parasteatoda tepidariorum]
MDPNLISCKGLENTTKKLYKDAKKYEDCILDVNRSEKKMTSDLSNSLLCHDEAKLRELVEEWHSYVSKAGVFDEDLVLLTRKTIVEPLKKFQGAFTETRSALKKREQAMQECAKAKEKVQKLQGKEKTGQNLVKLEAAKQNLVNLEEDFQALDRVLKSELPLLYEGRIEYFQPCLEALIKAQVEHSGNSAKLFTETIPSLKDFNYSEMELRQVQNQRFSLIHSLSIVGDN